MLVIYYGCVIMPVLFEVDSLRCLVFVFQLLGLL